MGSTTLNSYLVVGVSLKYYLTTRTIGFVSRSSCTNHIDRGKEDIRFTSYKAYDGGHVVFGSNLKGKVVGEESKEDVLEKFKILCKRLENLHDCSIASIVTNHSSEFDKLQFGSFCEQRGMSYNLSGPFTSQLNEIVERTHRKLRKMSRVINRKPSLEYFKVFGCKVFILNTKVHLTKFDPKSYEGVLLGYSQTSKAYIVLNKETMRIEESLNVTFDESLLEPKSSPSIEDDRINKPIVQDLNGSPSLQVNVSDGGYPKS
ncbi:retrovirus-related pol polyprotein from transposon TNT 1-94 [Tanacetum coccineum]|uniref:Retrovirus-related pol polyprotein from transposon TNT 1-94 n=1 Tax=Tanacetum coccineum TaxID=301880 RepID=A0ABQ5CG67_9ASTR